MFKDHMLHIDSNIDKEYNLGRNHNAQCMILDVNVSRRHATIKFDSSRGWTIMDKKVKMCQFFWVCLTCIILFFLQSTNGVFVNGRKIAANTNVKIKHCDHIGLDPEGNYEWRFETQKETAIEENSQLLV